MALGFKLTPIIKHDFTDNTLPTGLQVVLGRITMNTTYDTGGYVVSAAVFGLTSLVAVLPFPIAVTGVDGASYEPTWDQTAGKIKMAVGATGVEAASGLDALDGLVLQLLAVGY